MHSNCVETDQNAVKYSTGNIVDWPGLIVIQSEIVLQINVVDVHYKYVSTINISFFEL